MHGTVWKELKPPKNQRSKEPKNQRTLESKNLEGMNADAPHFDEPPDLLAICCRGSPLRIRGICPGRLAGPRGQDHRALSGGRFNRRAHAHSRRAPEGHYWTDRCDRES